VIPVTPRHNFAAGSATLRPAISLAYGRTASAHGSQKRRNLSPAHHTIGGIMFMFQMRFCYLRLIALWWQLGQMRCGGSGLQLVGERVAPEVL
jgi:hypothetical protein